jgi:hypothetical protein
MKPMGFIVFSGIVVILLATAGCMQPTGSVTLRSEPAGAALSVNGIDNQTAPKEIKDWPAGTYFINAKMDGYINKKETLRIKPGTNDPVTLVMVPIPVPADRKYSTITSMNTGITRNIAYIGDLSMNAQDTAVTGIRFTLGKTGEDSGEPFYLDGAKLTLVTGKGYVELGQDSPLFSRGALPAPGTWRIVDKINSEDDDTLDNNEQFVIAAALRPDQGIAAGEKITLEFKQLRGPSIVWS